MGRRDAFWLVLVLTPGACGEPGASADRVTRRDSAGIAIVETTTPIRTLGAVRRAFRIGAMDGPEFLYQVRKVFLLSGGGVGVVETSSGLIRLFNEEGEPSGEMGGVGEGPGEFRGLWWASQAWGDTVVAFDIAYPASLSYFDSAGEFVRSVPVPRVGYGGEPVVIGAWPNGDVLIRRQLSRDDVEPGETYEHAVYTVSTKGDVGEDFGLWVMGVHQDARQAYAHQASFSTMGHTLLYSPGDKFEVRQVDRNGDPRQISRLHHTRRPVTQADRDMWLEEVWSEVAARVSGTPFEQRLGEPLFADSIPAYTGVLGSRGGGFWAAARGARLGESDIVWDVFRENGRYIGSVDLPVRFEPMSMNNRYIAGVTRNDLDVEFVDVYAWDGMQ